MPGVQHTELLNKIENWSTVFVLLKQNENVKWKICNRDVANSEKVYKLSNTVNSAN